MDRGETAGKGDIKTREQASKTRAERESVASR